MARSDTQFKKGKDKTGGRKKGARNKFAAQFIADFAADWAKHGADVVESLREKDKAVYVRAAGALVPKDLDINHSGTINISVVDYQDDD